ADQLVRRVVLEVIMLMARRVFEQAVVRIDVILRAANVVIRSPNVWRRHGKTEQPMFAGSNAALRRAAYGPYHFVLHAPVIQRAFLIDGQVHEPDGIDASRIVERSCYQPGREDRAWSTLIGL